MDLSPLRVGNEAFLVASMIERCPKIMMLRELVTNAIEAAGQAPEGARRVEITGLVIDGVRKLTIFNSGPGMDALSLHRMCDIASSIGKTNSLEQNFGMGAKVATLPSNQLGLRYRSCTAGRVHQVIMGKRDGAYGRILQQEADGSVADVIDVTAHAAADGRSIGSDWTEVVLLGNHAGQDTVGNPYDGHPDVPHDWIEHYLHRRFFMIAAGTELTLGEGTHGGSGRMRFEPLGNRLETAFTRHEAVQTGDGVKVHYLYDATDPAHPGRTLSMRDGHVADSGAALIYRGELYDFRHGWDWTHEAPVFGISFGARNFSILVELADDMPVLPDGYREFMRWRLDHQAQVETRHFAGQVNQFRPQWLLDLLKEFAPKADHVDSVREDMSALFARLRVPRRWYPPIAETQVLEAPPSSPADEYTASVEAAIEDVDLLTDEHSEQLTEPPRDETLNLLLDPEAETPKEPDEEWEVPPQIIALRDEDDVAQRGMHNMAGRFYAETHQIFVNYNYGAVMRIRNELVNLFAAEHDQVKVREATLIVAEQVVTSLVCRHLVHGLAKHAEWPDWQVYHAVSNESLSIAADNYAAEMPKAREAVASRLTQSTQIALAQVLEPA